MVFSAENCQCVLNLECDSSLVIDEYGWNFDGIARAIATHEHCLVVAIIVLHNNDGSSSSILKITQNGKGYVSTERFFSPYNTNTHLCHSHFGHKRAISAPYEQNFCD